MAKIHKLVSNHADNWGVGNELSKLTLNPENGITNYKPLFLSKKAFSSSSISRAYSRK